MDMTFGGPGRGNPQQQPLPQHLPQTPLPPPPLTQPGWGAIPAVLGVVLAAIGLFALDWSRSMSFADISDAMSSYTGGDTQLNGQGQWVKSYIKQGVFIALVAAAAISCLWTLGTLRTAKGVKQRGGVMKKSLAEGRTMPTRILLSVLTGLCFVYHLVSVLIMTDNGKDLGDLGPGPWLLLLGAALIAIGTAIGPRVVKLPGR